MITGFSGEHVLFIFISGVSVSTKYFCSPMGIGLIQPPVQWVLGALSPGVKRPWREAYNSRLVPRLRLLILVNSVKSCLLCVVLM